MTPEQRAAHARALLADPVLVELMDRAEQDALARLVGTLATDHLALMAAQAAVRAFQNLRHDLTTLSAADNVPTRSGSIA